MKSYILGDLDISGEEASDLSSFEISSNSSVKSALSEKNESSSKKLAPFSKAKAEPVDKDDGGKYLRNDAY